MANLAIKGHVTRGKEVIEILEMLGGRIMYTYNGDDDTAVYFIDGLYIMAYKYKEINCENYKIFTLEEFLEKFPYKVGDRVRVPEYESEVCISKMRWDGWEVQYEVVTDEVEWYSAKELNEFNEPNKEKKINQMSLVNCDLDEVEIVLGDKFELKIEDGKYYAVKKKSLYPKTFEECCKVLGCKANHFFTNFSYNGCDVEISEYEDKVDDLVQNFRKLRYARDAYWKIAGEQMGLGKPWEPDFTNYKPKYCIYVAENVIEYDIVLGINTILTFPTAEMRDAFLENFGYLIEQCKELL